MKMLEYRRLRQLYEFSGTCVSFLPKELVSMTESIILFPLMIDVVQMISCFLAEEMSVMFKVYA